MKKSIRLFVTVFVLFSLGWLIGSVIAHFSNKSSQVAQPLLIPLADPIGYLSFLTDSNMKKTVEKSLEGTQGTYAIYIKNLKTGEVYVQKEHEEFQSGSLYKLWVMAVVYDQIKNGKLKETDQMKQDIAYLNKKFDIASESAELTEGEIDLPVKQALTQMITISHNYAALLLSEKVGLTNVAKFLKDQGFSESKIGQPPRTTAYDIGRFYEKLYKKELVSKEYSDKMIELLKKQQINDRIPKYLPDEIEVAHKTGEIEYFKHDGGIVFTQNGDYIFVVLSKSNSPQGAAEREAQLSKDMFDYFDKE